MKKRIILTALLICSVLCTVHAQRETARGHISQGQEHMTAGRFEEAIASFEAALRLEPRNRNAPSLLLEAQTKRTNQLDQEAARLQRANRLDEAIAMYERALASAPDGYNPYIIQSIKTEIEELKFARERVDAQTRTELIIADAQRLRQEGRIDEAAAKYDEAIASAPSGFNTRQITDAKAAMLRERTDSLFAEAQSLQHENNFAEAIAKYDEALASAPSGYNKYYITNGKTETQRAMERAEAQARTAQATQALQTATEFFSAGNYAEAITQLENAINSGGLNQSQTTETQNAITVLRDVPNKQASYNRPIRDDDFDVRQLQNGVEIIAFKASESMRITIGGRTYTITVGIQNVVIPNRLHNLSVIEIGVNVFRGKGLTSVTLPNSLVRIGSGAFSENRNLIRIEIPSSVTHIDEAGGDFASGVFQNCNLTTVILGNAVHTIGSFAFTGNKITSITLPASVRIIGYGAFRNNQITSLTIPNGVREIEGEAFISNPLTTLVIIPEADNLIVRHNSFPKTLTRVTLPANIRENMIGFDVRTFEEGLINFYTGQGRRAGTYVKNGPVWSRQ